MYNEVITLISEEKTIDAYGDPVITESRKNVFAQLKSIGQSEFYQAQAVGLKPEVKFVIADYFDYNGQKKLEFAEYEKEAEVYTVLRTYRAGNTLEIVCKRGIE